MNELSSLLTNVTLIATMIAALFGVASLVIHSRRKKHQLAMQQRRSPQSPPAAASAAVAKPESVMAFNASAPVAPQPSPVIESDNLVYDTRPTSSPLFKRLGRVGVEQVMPAASPEAATSDEQKSAWE